VTVREVTLADHDEWLAMRSALWPHCTLERHEAEMRQFSAQDGFSATFVAESEDGCRCGFVEISLRREADGCASSPVGYIEGIFVLPNFRRSGAGRLLTKAARCWAAARGCTELASDCHADNEASIQFHLRAGFEITERLVHFRQAIPAAEVNPCG
jgi:aminoglycoside 6'-N-acetyltransferase I